MSNSLGKLFTVTSFGESHGRCVGVVVDGCPAGLALGADDLRLELDKRKSRYAAGGTARAEADEPEILAGVFNSFTTGAPLCLLVWNRDIDSSSYEENRRVARPGHADYTAYIKYGGFNDYRGGGRFSGRITAGFVMAGAVARKLLKTIGIEVMAHTTEIGGIRAGKADNKQIRENTWQNPVRCADMVAAQRMIEAIEAARKDSDSLGGVVEAVATGVPAGLGEPAFDTLEGDLAKAVLAIPAVKGVEFGSGFEAARKKGSENNDAFALMNNKVITLSNHAGGVLGGISSGMPVVLRAAIKPTASIARSQQSVDLDKNREVALSVAGRHDACIVPRAVVVVEAMVAIILTDFALRAGLLPRVIK